MKKQTYLCIAAIMAAFLILGAVAVFLTLNFGDGLFSDTKAQSDAESEFHFETEARSTEPSADSRDHFLIWVGDSRTVGMRDAVRDECVYIGASGEGYNWFTYSGEAQMEAAILEEPDAPVVFNLGVNDYENIDLYIKEYQRLTEKFPDTVFYFLSVNPIDPALCQNITNEQIADFNSRLKESFPDTYIDSFTYLMANEIVPFDGVHYSEDAYQMLHDFVVNEL